MSEAILEKPPPRVIPLTRGKVTIVDAEDFEMLSAFRWCAHHKSNALAWYAHRTHGGGAMHRLLMNAPAGTKVDHKNRDGLDNRKENLRLATDLESSRNIVMVRISKTSRFRGVSWRWQSNRWHAQINLVGKKKHIGLFHDEVAIPNFPLPKGVAT